MELHGIFKINLPNNLTWVHITQFHYMHGTLLPNIMELLQPSLCASECHIIYSFIHLLSLYPDFPDKNHPKAANGNKTAHKQ